MAVLSLGNNSYSKRPTVLCFGVRRRSRRRRSTAIVTKEWRTPLTEQLYYYLINNNLLILFNRINIAYNIILNTKYLINDQ